MGWAMSDNRLTELEIQAAHQARQIEELDEVVRAQAKTIDLLELRLRAVANRLAEAEASQGGSVQIGDQKPPHY